MKISNGNKEHERRPILLIDTMISDASKCQKESTAMSNVHNSNDMRLILDLVFELTGDEANFET